MFRLRQMRGWPVRWPWTKIEDTRGLRIAATLSVDDPEAILRALPAIAPVRITARADGALLIQRR